MRIYAEFAPQGQYIALRRTGVPTIGGGLRGDITGFTPGSRSRLLKKVSKLQKHRIPLFLTLTYPDKYPTEREVYKEDLHNFFMTLRYHYPELGAIWRLEFQKRGAAHYHLLIWGVDLEAGRVLIPNIWYKIAGCNDERHLLFHQGKLNRSVHCLGEVRSWQGVKAYAAKYMSKPNGFELAKPGRCWGAVGKVPLSKLCSMKIDIAVALAFRRAHRRHCGFNSKRFGFWSFDYCNDWLRFVDDMQTDWEDRKIPPTWPPGWWKCKYIEDDEVIFYEYNMRDYDKELS